MWHENARAAAPGLSLGWLDGARMAGPWPAKRAIPRSRYLKLRYFSRVTASACSPVREPALLSTNPAGLPGGWVRLLATRGQPSEHRMQPACPADRFRFSLSRGRTPARTFSLARRRGNVRPCCSWKPNDPRDKPAGLHRQIGTRVPETCITTRAHAPGHILPSLRDGRMRTSKLTLRATMSCGL